ncbi:TauD/TfdA family dioxygenase [Duganella sp. FT50W]|uniref:TauD/TfdA family dioxygenase n=1 Tax=Duganella lactea TaxID=2692173 RepID=A0A6L8MS44_9BURK|nr:TauD/TfdA family dioxygenase [Duganella lactea]MYM84891.1 TauD/TfdA family dioxygenase [Duganella lactea]
MFEDATLTPLCPTSDFYAVLKPHREIDLVEWARSNQPAISAALRKNKAILFRNFKSQDHETFAQFVQAIARPLEYVYRSTPRTSIGEKLYTATEFPRQYSIPLHCENSYQADWPMQLFFYCKQPAAEGGATPIADIAQVTRTLDTSIKETFEKKEVLYVRNYGSGIDLNWQTVFQSQIKAEVEAYCRENQIEYAWKGENLQTRQRRPAMARHPFSQELLWFNQAHLFHVSALEAATRAAMLKIFPPNELPRNAYFGDGSELNEEELTHIRSTYVQAQSVFEWQRGDILMVDNMQVAHGRQPFIGERAVLVMMGNLHTQ